MVIDLWIMFNALAQLICCVAFLWQKSICLLFVFGQSCDIRTTSLLSSGWLRSEVQIIFLSLESGVEWESVHNFEASIIRRNLWPFKAVLETRLQRARRRCRTIWTKLAIPHIFANISIGCKLNQVFQSHRIDRCVQMNLNDHMVQPQIFYKWAFDNQRIFLKKGQITQL